MEMFKGIKVFSVTDEEIVGMLETPVPKFIFFVEEPEVLNRYFTAVDKTILKITSGYYKTNIKKENIYIIKTKKVIIEDILMEDLDKVPVGVFSPTPGDFSIITF